jgi:hypothetical protein
MAGTLPPLIDLPLIVISCEPWRFIGLEEVYPEVTAVAVVVAVVVVAPVVVAAVEVVPVAGVVAPVGVVAVEDVEPDGVDELVVAPVAVVSATLAGVTIASFLQDANNKIKATKKA